MNRLARAEWTVETTGTVHILAVLRLLLLAHTVDVISRNFGVFGSSEPSESHGLSHHCFHLILVRILLEVNIHFIFHMRAIGVSSIVAIPRVSAARSTVIFIASRRG